MALTSRQRAAAVKKIVTPGLATAERLQGEAKASTEPHKENLRAHVNLTYVQINRQSFLL